MFRPFPLFVLLGLAGLCAIACLAQPADDALSRARRATALVLVETSSGRVHGTAVCVVRGGLFATNAHTVRGARASEVVKLVLNPGASDQRIVAARVAEIDEAVDLALLETDTKPAAEPVAIAPEQDLHENMSVTRLRFPAPAASSGGGYPGVSSTEDRIVALPRDASGRLRVQLDAPLGIKATEGASFDETGRLVGIATRTQGPNQGFILPAVQIADLLQGLIIVFDPPAVEAGDLARPRPWPIGLKGSGTAAPARDLTVSLTLSTGTGDRRTYSAEPIGAGQFRATVVPLPPRAERRFALTSTSDYHWISVVGDMTVRIGEKPLRLSELAYIENQPMPRAIATDGRIFKGRATGMESIPFVNRPDTTRVLDFSQVASFMVRPDAAETPVAAIEVEVEVQRRGETLSRVKKSLEVKPPSNAAGPPPEIGALPQPSEQLEALIDSQGWLDLKGAGSRGASASIRNPSVEIGAAQVSRPTTAPSQLESGRLGAFRQVSLSPDGWFLITAGDDGFLDLWRVQGGFDPQVVGQHLGPINRGAPLATAGYRQPQLIGQHRGPINGAVFSPDGRFVLSGGDDGLLKSWNLIHPQGVIQPAEFRGHAGAVSSVAISRDGQLALSSSHDGTARLWRWPSGQELRRFDGHKGAVHRAVFLPDSRRAVSCGQDGTVRLWDVRDGRELRSLDARSGVVLSLAAAPDGHTVLAGYTDGTARLWDVETGKTIRTLTGHTDRVESVAFSPVGDVVASCGGANDWTVVVWEVSTGRELLRLKDHTGAVHSVAISPDGSGLFSAGKDHTVRIRTLIDGDLWTPTAGEPLVRELGEPIRDIVPGGGGRYLILTLEGPRRVAVFDVNSASVVTTIPVSDEKVYVAAGAASFFLGLANKNRVEEWDFATLARRNAWPLPIKGRLLALALGSDSDGPLLAAWEVENAERAMGSRVNLYLCIIDPRTGKALRVRSHHDRGESGPGTSFRDLARELPAPSACPSVVRNGIECLLRPTDDGRRFLLQAVAGNGFLTGFVAIDLDHDFVRSFRAQAFNQGLAVPSADGEAIFTVNYGTLNRDGQTSIPREIAESRDRSLVLIPSSDPRYHLEIKARLDKTRWVGSVVELAIKDRSGTLLATVSRLEEMSGFRWHGMGPDDPLFDRRFRFIPSARLLITIPPDQGRLQLRRIDLDEILQRPLRALSGEKLPRPRSKAAGPATTASDGGSTRVRDRLADFLRSCWAARTTLLGVLTALSYLAVLAYRRSIARQAKKQTPKAHHARRRRIGRLFIFTAYGLTLACVYVEGKAFATARAAAQALDARLAQAEREVVTRNELESLIGRAPDRSALEKDGSIVAHYEWKGVIRQYTLRVEYVKGDSGEEVVLNQQFE
jgi:WD40 repeat protein